jgi:CheY-like chemotaxis protein
MEPKPLTLLPTSYHYESNKILVLEDEETVSAFIKFALEPRNEIVAVCDGVDGVRNIQKSDFDVIICDMMMPRLPGDMFYAAVERIKPHLCSRFIFMTGYTKDEKIQEFISRIDGLMLHKPFKYGDLLEMIAFVQVRTHLASLLT